MIDRAKCPHSRHIHVVYERVGSLSRPSKTIHAKTPLEALGNFLIQLDPGWKGSISIFDDTNGHEDEMPLLHRIIE